MSKAKRLGELFEFSKCVDQYLDFKELNIAGTNKQLAEAKDKLEVYKEEIRSLNKHLETSKKEEVKKLVAIEEELRKAKADRTEAIEIAQQLEKENKKISGIVKSKNEELQSFIESQKETNKKHKQEIDSLKLQYEQELFILRRIGKA